MCRYHLVVLSKCRHISSFIHQLYQRWCYLIIISIFYLFSISDDHFKLFVCCLNDLLTISLSLIFLYCLKTPLLIQRYFFHISYISLLRVSCLIKEGFSYVLGRPIFSRCRFSWRRLYYALIVNSFCTLTVKDDGG